MKEEATEDDPQMKQSSTQDEHVDLFSWIATLMRIENCIKPILNVVKVLFTLVVLVAGFPWLYVSAYFVETKKVIDYSWSEVFWRCFGGVGLIVNGIAPYIVLVVVMEKYIDQIPGLAALMGYGIGMGLLVICQAFWGRYYEEINGPGGGQKAVMRFYLYMFQLLGVNVDDVQPMSTSWTWAFSLLSLFLASIFTGCFTVFNNLSDWNGVTGLCSGEVHSCDQAPSNVCEPNEVLATFDDSCSCCRLMVMDFTYIDTSSELGGLVIFYYGIFRVVATFLVWAEKRTNENKEEKEYGENSGISSKRKELYIHKSSNHSGIEISC
mmetsp:Transcript_21997/g.32491  ORF Transcript_21997/g.32491 Transcript_21997/m.32491 type:complete len:323 (+) Transcript_21997:156-1124(+)|eukprot:CAMPEP_0194205038 /NCGR_PEP_ID=MMETSP0156-20130528/4395_1 /TAXON_ID=33649 /ORGANISM="Thalassionema nitzschioides, Strain L26-B" /LENGTH=322 /DNA_ID=CAMNT_0038931195 /DNA_START=61 /DNA_END=1029 /DNA_ORIENTATION=-